MAHYSAHYHHNIIHNCPSFPEIIATVSVWFHHFTHSIEQKGTIAKWPSELSPQFAQSTDREYTIFQLHLQLLSMAVWWFPIIATSESYCTNVESEVSRVYHRLIVHHSAYLYLYTYTPTVLGFPIQQININFLIICKLSCKQILINNLLLKRWNVLLLLSKSWNSI